MKKLIGILVLAAVISAAFTGCTQTTSTVVDQDAVSVSGGVSTAAPTASPDAEEEEQATSAPSPTAAVQATEAPAVEEEPEDTMTAAEAAADQEAIATSWRTCAP